MARSLAFVKALQDRRFMPQEISGALVKSLFNDGRAAMVISGPWFTWEIDPGVHYAIAPLPVVTRRPACRWRPSWASRRRSSASRTAQPDAAQALAQFLSLGEATILRATLGRQIPADAGRLRTTAVRDGPRCIASFRAVAERATPTPNTLEMARVWEPMKLALRAVLQGGVVSERRGRAGRSPYRALNREAPAPRCPVPWTSRWCSGVVVLGGGGRCARRGRAVLRAPLPRGGAALAYVGAGGGGAVRAGGDPLRGRALALASSTTTRATTRFVGLANFVDILASRGYRVTEPLSFYFTLVVTVVWTLVNVVLHVSIGLALALLLKDPLLKLRGVYRVLLIVPWAVPNYITALMWKGMFHRQFGAINAMLVALGIEPVSWFTRFSTSFAANLVTNTWLGFPFMMVVSLGALQSIPQDLYEAAEVDGASKWAQFRRITLPLLKPGAAAGGHPGQRLDLQHVQHHLPRVSGGEPGGATDILVTEAYRWAFERNEQYGFAAAYSVLIFFVLLGWSKLTKRLSRRRGMTYDGAARADEPPWCPPGSRWRAWRALPGRSDLFLVPVGLVGPATQAASPAWTRAVVSIGRRAMLMPRSASAGS